MGFYIDTPKGLQGRTPMEWLREHGELLDRVPTEQDVHKFREQDKMIVCLIHLGPDSEPDPAGICFSPRELRRFQHPNDIQLKLWWTAPIELLMEVSPFILDAEQEYRELGMYY